MIGYRTGDAPLEEIRISRPDPANTRKPNLPPRPIAATMSRLLQLRALLPDTLPGATPTELTQLGNKEFKWGITKRTVDRNLIALRQQGFARTVKSRRKHPNDLQHWMAEPDIKLKTPRMGNADALALHLIARVADSLLPPEIVGVLRSRIEDARTHLERRRKVDREAAWAKKIAVLPSGFTLRPPEVNEKILHGLQSALLSEKQISCAYSANEKKPTKSYHLEPRALVLRGNLLYLIASRPDKTAKRTAWYRADRFLSVKVLDQSVSKSGFQLDLFLANGGGEFGAKDERISFEAWVSDDLSRTLDEAPLSEDMKLTPVKGGAIVTANVWQSWLFESWILSRGRDLRVIAPASLRDAIAARHRGAWEAYQAA